MSSYTMLGSTESERYTAKTLAQAASDAAAAKLAQANADSLSAQAAAASAKAAGSVSDAARKAAIFKSAQDAIATLPPVSQGSSNTGLIVLIGGAAVAALVGFLVLKGS